MNIDPYSVLNDLILPVSIHCRRGNEMQLHQSPNSVWDVGSIVLYEHAASTMKISAEGSC
jgi:hypothetical protein